MRHHLKESYICAIWWCCNIAPHAAADGIAARAAGAAGSAAISATALRASASLGPSFAVLAGSWKDNMPFH